MGGYLRRWVIIRLAPPPQSRDVIYRRNSIFLFSIFLSKGGGLRVTGLGMPGIRVLLKKVAAPTRSLRLGRIRVEKPTTFNFRKKKMGVPPTHRRKKDPDLFGGMRGGSNLVRRFPGGEVLPLAYFPDEKCNIRNTLHSKRLNKCYYIEKDKINASIYIQKDFNKKKALTCKKINKKWLKRLRISKT